MAGWKQDRAFSLAKMGTTKNFCLRNVRQAFGVGPKYANAKLAMGENRTKGTLHALSSMPANVAVPVYSANGVFGHVEVCDHGTYYSDGKKVSKPGSSYMWGEWLNGVRIVHYESTPAPKPGIKVGDTVIVNGQGTGNSKGGGGKTKSFSNRKMKVISIANGRYGCNQYNRSGAITGWFSSSQVKKG